MLYHWEKDVYGLISLVINQKIARTRIHKIMNIIVILGIVVVLPNSGQITQIYSNNLIRSMTNVNSVQY